MNLERRSFLHVYFLCQDLSDHTIIFYLVTFAWNFESHTLNVAILFWLPFGKLRGHRHLTTFVLIYHMSQPLGVSRYWKKRIAINGDIFSLDCDTYMCIAIYSEKSPIYFSVFALT